MLHCDLSTLPAIPKPGAFRALTIACTQPLTTKIWLKIPVFRAFFTASGPTPGIACRFCQGRRAGPLVLTISGRGFVETSQSLARRKKDPGQRPGSCRNIPPEGGFESIRQVRLYPASSSLFDKFFGAVQVPVRSPGEHQHIIDRRHDHDQQCRDQARAAEGGVEQVLVGDIN